MGRGPGRQGRGPIHSTPDGVLSGPERAQAFAEEFGLSDDAVIGTYDDVLARPEADAVYIATVHTGHAPPVARALAADTYVPWEKPLTTAHGTAMALADPARRRERRLLEGHMYRLHP